MFDVYFPSNWTYEKMMEWAEKRELRPSTAFMCPQYYPFGLFETEWQQIIWGWRFWIPA